MNETLVSCQGANGNKARKALLGWLIEAFTLKQAGLNHHIRRGVCSSKQAK